MFDHVSLAVSDLDRSRPFYDAVLGALGHVRLFVSERAATYGPAGFTGEAPFGIVVPRAGPPAVCATAHLAFVAIDRARVDAFHRAALAHGGRCDGPPGTRHAYGPGYYACFVLDPDGHRLEAVVHETVRAGG